MAEFAELLKDLCKKIDDIYDAQRAQFLKRFITCQSVAEAIDVYLRRSRSHSSPRETSNAILKCLLSKTSALKMEFEAEQLSAKSGISRKKAFAQLVENAPMEMYYEVRDPQDAFLSMLSPLEISQACVDVAPLIQECHTQRRKSNKPRRRRPQDPGIKKRVEILHQAKIFVPSDLHNRQKVRNAFAAVEHARCTIPGFGTCNWMVLLNNPDKSEELKKVKESLRLALTRSDS